MPTVKKWKDALERPADIEALDLDARQLERVRFPAHRVLPDEIGRFTSLRKLRIRTRNLAELCSAFTAMQSLESLTIDAGDMVFQFRDELAALGALRTLDLGGLGLTGPIRLPPSLEVLRLTGNEGLELEAWVPTLAALPNLRELELSDCFSEGIPPAVGALPSLQTLVLRDHRCGEVPEALGDLHGLHTLDLAGNSLTQLPPSVARLQGLRVLRLHNNQLDAVPPVVRTLAGLETLLLDHNPLTSVPDWIGELRGLETLGLSATGLADLPPSLLTLPLRTLYVDAPPAVVDRVKTQLPKCKVVSRSRADVESEVQGWLGFLGKA